MKVSIAQNNPIIGDITGNKQLLIASISQAKKEKSDLLITSELFLCGYPPLDLLFAPQFIENLEQALQDIIPETKGICVLLGTVRRNPDKKEKFLYNCAALLQDGHLIGFYDKQLLPTYDVFDEKRYFEPGSKSIVFKLCDKKIGVTICEDLWQHSELLKDTCYKHDPVNALICEKIDLLVNLSASPFSAQKPQIRLDVLKKAASTLQCPVIFCNQVGANDGLIFDGNSIVIDKVGSIIGKASGFSEELLTLDTEKSVTYPFDYNEMEGLYSALVLGVKDYFRKTGFSKACLGLSGGIDSALVACIATDALGKENVLALSMPSRYSSIEGQNDAILLAGSLGISFKEISIESVFQAYLHLLAPHLHQENAGVTQENLQARVRGMLLMALANNENRLVLNTANKSELAMGYSTLYGDSCGALSVLGDIYKTTIYALVQWLNKSHEIIPSSIVLKAPSAELRENQKDTDSLPAYEILDEILASYIEGELSADIIAQKMHLSCEFVQRWIKKLYQNEYKRKQSPLILRVSEKALTPLVGRCVPIAQRYIR